ncbi:Imm39 family immunity protein [Erythrobacter sp. BLCC-B19]|uniref:Imm39 family immunity protein n=1 Tax=Erythrobacter sp. BLCC-B19 TaxID=3025315 RepID=UPI00235E01F2|nr:Imm39 family immunity protein [Erythrobacter sp. BLCC-B19]WDA42053.1 Imm39 family immunity protein [Erythrobacter sp. BLCC-B19]
MQPPAKPPHDTKLGFTGVALTTARLPKTTYEAFAAVKAELEPILVASGFFKDAPFSWITLAIRYGLRNEEKPHYGRISKKYGDLPLSLEVDVHEMLGASLDELKVVIRRASLRALIHAGEKYHRPINALRDLADQGTLRGSSLN